jgi:serine protease AprX
MQNVIAYYMHEIELTEVLTLIRDNFVVTDGFVKGRINDDDLQKLKNSKIIFTLINDDAVVSVPSEDVKEQAKSNFINVARVEIDPPAGAPALNQVEYPGYFLISIDGPLLKEYRVQLENMGARIVNYVPHRSYSVFIYSADQLKELENLPFVIRSEFYGLDQTGVREKKKSGRDDPSEGMRKKENLLVSATNYIAGMITPAPAEKIYDLVLQEPSALPELKKLLADQNIEIIGSSKFKIRIKINSKSELKLQLAAQKYVQAVAEYVEPILHDSLVRNIVGITHTKPDTQELFQTLDLDGTGQIVGVADTGIYDVHTDLQDRIHTIIARGRPGNHNDEIGHGTHVAGLIAGDGTASKNTLERVIGMAPGSKIFFQSIAGIDKKLKLPVDLSELFQEAYDTGVRIHNNSWGSNTESYYTANSMEVDGFVNDKKDMLLVFSAGNSGKANLPTSNGYVEFLSIGSPASAKNVLTVGASRSSRTRGGHAELTYREAWGNSFPKPPISVQRVSGDPEAIAGFSSRGPCDDYRFKPDVMAPGTDIASLRSGHAQLSEFCGILPSSGSYVLMCGTSMAAPIVSGLAALVRQYYTERVNLPKPSAALLKATIINGTRTLSGTDALYKQPVLPNNHQGFGIIDAGMTVPNAGNNFKLFYVDDWEEVGNSFNFSGEARKYRLTLNGDGPNWFRVCLAYTDAPGRGIQNKIGLLVDRLDTKDKWMGNQGSDIPMAIFPDRINNVEVIRETNATAGEYTIKVTAANIPKGPQDFALVVTTSCTDAVFELDNH